MISKEKRSKIMSAIRSSGTKPEMAVRKLVHGLGFRYRLHRKDLPGKPDLVFGPKKKVIFVHGCFWHQHKDPNCKNASMPRSNIEYWTPKLRRNIERDIENVSSLESLGWDVMVIWECETKNDVRELEARLLKFLDNDNPQAEI